MTGVGTEGGGGVRGRRAGGGTALGGGVTVRTGGGGGGGGGGSSRRSSTAISFSAGVASRSRPRRVNSAKACAMSEIKSALRNQLAEARGGM